MKDQTRGGAGAASAVLYARVSSKDQEREGFSIPAQQKLLRQYAREHGLVIVQEFVDVETAKLAGRAGFGEMLTFLRSNASCRTILVEKTDRLYRNIRDWITDDDLDLAVHFVKENTVVSKASRSSEKFMHGIKVLMAKNYVDNLSEEVKKGLREKAEQGHWPSVAPIGYVNNLATHRIDVDPVRGPIVSRLFERYARARCHSMDWPERLRRRGSRFPALAGRCSKARFTGSFRIPSTTAISAGSESCIRGRMSRWCHGRSLKPSSLYWGGNRGRGTRSRSTHSWVC